MGSAFFARSRFSSLEDTPSKLWGAMAGASEAGNQESFVQHFVFAKF
jgi:hypothetical protein